MTLRARLLISTLLLSLVTTLGLALVVRDAWRGAEATEFQHRFEDAVAGLEKSLGATARDLSLRLAPICDHDPVIDSALVGLQARDLGPRLLSVRARIDSLRSSLSLSELVLLSSDGSVLGGSFGGGAYSSAELVELALKTLKRPGFVQSPERTFVAACKKTDSTEWVALVASRHLDPLLAAASSPDFRLTVSDAGGYPSEEPEHASGALVQTVQAEFLDGAFIQAVRSRVPLAASLRYLDLRVFSAALLALFGAVVLSLFLSRGLSRPVVLFALKTRAALSGKVEALPVTGGPELEEAARAFNATLDDLRALRQRLKVTERIAARREVARQIAHEIKNPLSPIRTSIETLRKLKSRGHPEFDHYFNETTQTVLEEVKRISNLASNFAEYARLPSPQPQELDLAALTRKMVALHQDLGATVTLSAVPLPLVSADPEQISQVVTNLIKNAIEATAMLPTPIIELHIGPHLDGVTLTVSDNGPGVDVQTLPLLFEPYSTTKEGGSGLGLPISQRIAIEHGGELSYRDREGGGAEFTLHLPTSGPPSFDDDG